MLEWLTALIVLATYGGVAVGQIPYSRMNRATIALVGAALLILIGALRESEALAALDTGTLLLLGAMMILNNNLRLAGFFEWMGYLFLTRARTPGALLAVIIGLAGVLSAFFLNDTICLMFTPLVLEMTARLRQNPIPYLIGLATATNIGSTATITGNPQNLIIGQASAIPYATFAAYLTPVALLGLVVCWGVIMWVFRQDLRDPLPTPDLPAPRLYPPLLWRTLGVVTGLLLAFLAGLPIVSSACIAAGALLISRIRPEKLLDIDWELLAFFGGLFVVTGAIEITGLSGHLFSLLAPALEGGVASLSLTTALLSNVVSNVPAVLLLRPEMSNQQEWLTLAMSSTLAGNFTLLGSAANLIVAEIAAKRGVRLTFMAYLKAGLPITVITLLIGVVWLEVVF